MNVLPKIVGILCNKHTKDVLCSSEFHNIERSVLVELVKRVHWTSEKQSCSRLWIVGQEGNARGKSLT